MKIVSDKASLKEYRSRRDFTRTPEPPASDARSESRPIFVIQKHSAGTLHYDLRLEAEGVLKSWAVPKGPSTNPKEKRLALPTEDHPIEYADFEGIIPEGEYGAGTVMVWDRGTYRNLTEKDGRPVPLKEAIRNGHLSVWLEGSKIRGGYALTRFRTGKEESWLLVKMNDEEADPTHNPITLYPESVISGRTIQEIARKQN